MNDIIATVINAAELILLPALAVLVIFAYREIGKLKRNFDSQKIVNALLKKRINAAPEDIDRIEDLIGHLSNFE